MDPITIAIVAGVAAGLTKGLADVSETAVKDAYNGVKAIIKKKFGEKNAVNDAIEGVENNPDSKAREAVLTEEVVKAGADKDSDVLEKAKTLIEALENYDGTAEIDLEKLKGGKIKIGDLLAEGGDASISVKDAEAEDTLEIGNVTVKAGKK